MAGWIAFVALAAAAAVSMHQSHAAPTEPISLMVDAYGNPMMVVREKRTPVLPYPQRAMMFTGYYRPVRRTANGGQASGVFAQGNAVSGQAFFSGVPSSHLHRGPEPVEEPEVSSAEAHAAPDDDVPIVEQQEEQQSQPQDEEHYQPEEQHHQVEQHQHHHHRHEEEHTQEEEEQPEQDRDALPPQDQHEPEPVPLTTEVPAIVSADDPVVSSTEVSASVPKPRPGSKTKKTTVVVEDDEEEDDEEDDEPVVPFVPFKGNRRRQNYPNLNNFFPMVFSFPGVATRAGSSGSPPGAITAIANSYSTGKGGVASSVATAYGGSPNGKKRRTPPSEE